MTVEASARSDRTDARDGSECDVLVIGGGPAGSTAAAVLAERGRDVVVIEKAEHPRFHIGESLLPANLPLFDRLGLSEAVRDIGLYKPGAEFVSDDYGKSNLFFFANASHLVATHSYQIRRATFDQLLFANCRRRGARTFENMRVTDIALAGAERPVVTAVGSDGATATWRPRFVVDASGRDTVLASQLGLKTVNKRNNTAAIFGHFTGVPRREGSAEGVITIYLVEDGWFWMIPLPDGQMSVGLVGNPALFKHRKQGIEALFWSTVGAAPSVAARMASARIVAPLATTGNYSYTTRSAWGRRFLLIGDALAFVDPIFSSGVMIAMTSGVLGAEAIDLYLSDEARGSRALRDVERRIRRAIAQLSWLIYRINDPVMRFMLMYPNNRFGMRDGLIALLAGQVFEEKSTIRGSMAVFKLVYHVLRALRWPARVRRKAAGFGPPAATSTG
jgi:flavin-dependent dehydrogenase